ncbi:MAG: aldo/keto reductase [Bauldia sp.]|uniref:aldo/keto reductase n=1 Tax=Bauldia sp. TaxID=2575872 RepID=UPI001D62D6F4|nr:aldo/keto reductase [Bauldia sp.]MCB1488820.1 aldo/keto reductase [Bauldia sp.]MCB1496611.1 aldo/keto reductase [Bauldia sp.]
MTEDAAVAWGIIGPGAIARQFASALSESGAGRLAAIATRDPNKPGLAEAFPGARIIDGYAAILADPEVEAIYIATPHTYHAEWAVRAAEAGKHVLCEKPLAVSAAEAAAMTNAARQAGTFLGEAFMYRLHPLTARIVDLVRSGALGEVRLIKASAGINAPNSGPDDRLFANDAAGGAILDTGCYPVSAARLIAGAASGLAFLEPVAVHGAGHLGDTGVDEWSAAVLRFPGDILAEVSASLSLTQDNALRIFGTRGWMSVASPWRCTESGPADIVIHRPDGTTETEAIDEPRHLYSFEIEAATAAIREGRCEFSPPGPTWDDTIGNMKALDQWRADIGLVYGFERDKRSRLGSARRGLASPANPMPRRMLPGLPREVSVVALGGANFTSFPQAAEVCDAYFERGGNVLDSAWLYGNGLCDELLGAWMAARGIREEIVLVGKGANAPLTYPDVIARQLTESLDRLQTDHVDIYFMHRDNPEIPVGEFVDALDHEVEAGRIRSYGGSNWTRERMDAAIAYAERNHKRPPGALSNNFSLAEMVNPVWNGTLAASDDAWKSWLAERQIPDFAWSSQARGFFTDRAGPDKLDDPELVNGWYSDMNFARRARAIELGERLGKSPLHVALAYCLHQAFPVVPLIGPLSLAELEDSLEALDITLTADDLRWLEQGDEAAGTIEDGPG